MRKKEGGQNPIDQWKEMGEKGRGTNREGEEAVAVVDDSSHDRVRIALRSWSNEL